MQLTPPYEFPKPVKEDAARYALSREALIAKNLELNILPRNKAQLVFSPYEKPYASNSSTPESLLSVGPIDDLLQQGSIKLDKCAPVMPYDSYEEEKPPCTPEKRQKSPERGLSAKKSRSVLRDIHTQVEKQGNFMESPKKFVIREPKELKKHNEDNESKSPTRHRAKDEDTTSDPLACHAENIMRMAMDSTMLGSFNHSFSSTFSNLADESIRRDDDADRSALELMKKRWPASLLDKLRAKRVEISADDLSNAVAAPML